jgi:hypothetical protein
VVSITNLEKVRADDELLVCLEIEKIAISILVEIAIFN